MFSFCDLEFADGAAVHCKMARAAQVVLEAFQQLGAGVGLRFNTSKCVELVINSEERLYFMGGRVVPRASSAKYLG
eukprot:11478234-Alexandrium_andersonii.AAC.1